MNSTFIATRDAILTGLQEWYPESVLDGDNRIMIMSPTGAAYVSLIEHENTPGDSVVVAAIGKVIAYEVSVTPEVTTWVATEGSNFLIGHVTLINLRDGVCDAAFTSSLLVGSDLNPIGAAVAATLESTSELEELFVTTFDGSL
jgi:hypothetical protein